MAAALGLQHRHQMLAAKEALRTMAGDSVTTGKVRVGGDAGVVKLQYGVRTMCRKEAQGTV